MKLLRKFDFLAAPVVALVAAALFIAENRHHLRKRVQPLKKQTTNNSIVASAALPVLRFAMLPAMLKITALAGKHRFGLLRWIPLPRPLRYLLAFLLLDYGNYLWHILNHRSKFLWRFHNVHHTDLDLSLTTAWRFHFGEVLFSVLFRGGVAGLTGASPKLVLLYEAFYEACTGFHHSNLKLPCSFERQLCKLLVTPRMHGIHHSIVAEETGSNFSVIFSCWDNLHKTLLLNVPQQDITVGVPAWRDPAEQTPGYLLALPFLEQRPWRLPNGTEPRRKTPPKTAGLAC